MAALLITMLSALLTAPLGVAPASAVTGNTCGYGTTARTGTPALMAKTVCWIDFTGYDGTIAGTAAGQPFTINMPGGYTMSFDVKRTSSSNQPLSAVAFPTWAGTPVGNTGGEFIGTPGKPALYATSPVPAGSSNITLDNMVVKDPSGQAVTGWSIFQADVETTNTGESLTFNTNGGAYQLAEVIAPLNAGNPPCGGTYTGIGTQTVTCNGAFIGGWNGDLLLSTKSPTRVSTAITETSTGQQGIAFGISTSQLTLKKQVQARFSDTDQFDVTASTSGGTVVGDVQTSGTGSTYTSSIITLLPGVAYTLTEKAIGTTDLTQYQKSWSCTNANAGSPTALPSGSTLPAGLTTVPLDNITCTLTNLSVPSITLNKSLGSARSKDTDQFSVALRTGSATGTVVSSTANATTTGTGSTVTAGTGTSGKYVATSGTAYYLTESPSGTTDLTRYDARITCVDANGMTSGLPNNVVYGPNVTVTPAMGARITCTITNTLNKPNIEVTKTYLSSSLDPATGTGTATYRVTVAGSLANGTYGPLVDTPELGSGLTVTGANWTVTGGPAGGSASGAGPFTLAPAGTAITAGATHTYTVNVKFTYSGGTVSTTCAGQGTALFNRVALPTGQETGSTTNNADCGPLWGFGLEKLNQQGTRLDGSTWRLATDNAGQPGITLNPPGVNAVSGQTGLFGVAGLPAGTYWLTETKAPTGYNLLAQPVQIIIAADGTVTRGSGGATAGVSVTRLADGSYRFSVEDVKTMSLPLTGGSGSRPVRLTGLGLLALATLALLLARIRRAGGTSVSGRTRGLRTPPDQNADG